MTFERIQMERKRSQPEVKGVVANWVTVKYRLFVLKVHALLYFQYNEASNGPQVSFCSCLFHYVLKFRFSTLVQTGLSLLHVWRRTAQVPPLFSLLIHVQSISLSSTSISEIYIFLAAETCRQ